MSFPNRERRTACYNARDAYWACLDKNDNKTESCQSTFDAYTKECPPLWVKHFTRKRDYEKFKEEVQTRGFDPETEKAS